MGITLNLQEVKCHGIKLKKVGELLKTYAISNGLPTEKILVTKNVENTAEEAMAVKELISPNKKNYTCNFGLSYVQSKETL